MNIRPLHPTRKHVCIILTLILILFMIPNYVGAQSEHPHLPPRPQPTPPLSPPSGPEELKRQDGAWIELQTTPVESGLWTGVQWADGVGNWNDVSGWQGTFNQPDHVLWFVEQKDFGKGPFRWLVYTTPRGALLAASPSFYLPATVGAVVRVEVVLPDLRQNYQYYEPAQVGAGQPYSTPPRYWTPDGQFGRQQGYASEQWSPPCSSCHLGAGSSTVDAVKDEQWSPPCFSCHQQ